MLPWKSHKSQKVSTSQKSAKVCKSLTSRKESSNVVSKGLDVTKRSKCKVRVNYRNVRCSTLNRTAGSYVILFFFTSPAQSFSNAHVQCGCEMHTCSASATGPEKAKVPFNQGHITPTLCLSPLHVPFAPFSRTYPGNVLSHQPCTDHCLKKSSNRWDL